MTMAANQQPSNARIPDHVPPELVRNIGLTEGPEFLASPHEFMANLHDTHPPIFFSTSSCAIRRSSRRPAPRPSRAIRTTTST
jgi:hypothetical protein